ncbi:MAG TPA: cytochrome c [Candidatus Eisenbacteria bacterium]|nr:cytochrome c [Candidatus Eisenbacteria bacterium]
MLRRILLGLVLLIALTVVGVAIFIASRQNLRFNPPEPEIAASADSAVIARGHYVVRVVGNCAECHGATDHAKDYEAGADVPLSGGFEFKIPPGEFRVPNITPDPETGIGRFTDGAIARALRLGVGHDGRALLPFMEMQGLSDEDLTAVISYLRSQAPVHHQVPGDHYTLLGRIVRATVLTTPVGPKSPPPHDSPQGPTVERGRYLAGSVANCWACHTARNNNTGQLAGPMYAGTTGFTHESDPTRSWNPPNLTPDPKTGRSALFSEDNFVARFRAGKVIPGSPMPWQALRSMTDDDIRAIYRFLRTLPPVVNDVGPPSAAKS